MSLVAAGADFTNTFRSLSQIRCPFEEDAEEEEEQLRRGAELLLQQCSSWEELKAANKPTMDPRWVLQTAVVALSQLFSSVHFTVSRTLWPSDVGRRENIEYFLRGAEHVCFTIV